MLAGLVGLTQPHPISPCVCPTPVMEQLCSKNAIFHLLDVLSTTVFIILLFLEITCPLCHSHPPPHFTDSRALCAPAPPSSICCCLDNLPSIFIFNPNSLIVHNLKIYRKKHGFILFCLLPLAGDVEINPGPVQSILPTINLASFQY